ncbi:hypothetical protein [Cohnella rhizosphaerae]|uniref:hypothetical protein n=1 Tax=Cohnella rhizosphaerae TaxID=1457232 RepID=UPI0030B8D7A9
MINAMNFARVTVVEPHSDVTPALLDRSEAVYPTLELLSRVTAETGFDPAADYLFFPDAGAQKRYGQVDGFRQLVGHKGKGLPHGAHSEAGRRRERRSNGFQSDHYRRSLLVRRHVPAERGAASGAGRFADLPARDPLRERDPPRQAPPLRD